MAPGLQRDDAEMMQALDVVGLRGENAAVKLLRLGELTGAMALQRRGEFLVDRRVRAAHCLGFIGHGLSSRLGIKPCRRLGSQRGRLTSTRPATTSAAAIAKAGVNGSPSTRCPAAIPNSGVRKVNTESRLAE